MINIDTRILPIINESELWLLVAIAKRFDVRKSSFPSNETLLSETGWGKDKLRATKDSLCAKGILEVRDRFDKNGKQTSNLYTVKTEYLSVFVNLSNKESENQTPYVEGVGKSEGSGVGKSDPEVLTNEVLTTNNSLVFFIDAAELVYKSYPTKCPIKGSSTGKSTEDKKKILSILKSKKYTAEKLIEIINWYIADCKKTNTFVKNLSTFLNKIPDTDTSETPEEKINVEEAKSMLMRNGYAEWVTSKPRFLSLKQEKQNDPRFSEVLKKLEAIHA